MPPWRGLYIVSVFVFTGCAESITDANGPLTRLCVRTVIPLHLIFPKQRHRLCDGIDMLLCVAITFSAAQS